jgi:hypothetical protein
VTYEQDQQVEVLGDERHRAAVAQEHALARQQGEGVEPIPNG